DVTALAVVALVRTLRHSSRHDDTNPLLKKSTDLISKGTPGEDVEVARVLLPLACLLVAVRNRHREGCLGRAGSERRELGVCGQIPDDCDACIRHEENSNAIWNLCQVGSRVNPMNSAEAQLELHGYVKEL